MQLTGILRSWNDDRGFGFIAPTHGGAELFVHVSAFPRDGSRPVEGESLVYELGRGQNGKPQAMRVVRRAIGTRPPKRDVAMRNRRSAGPLRFGTTLLTLVMLASVAYYGYARWAHRASSSWVDTPPTESRAPAIAAPLSSRCDGRTYCSQMTSCAEATWFLKNCPGAQMDGNHDGVPCEQQWCR